MDKIIFDGTVSNCIRTDWTRVIMRLKYKMFSSGRYNDIRSPYGEDSEHIFLVEETDDSGKPYWKIRFNAHETSESYIQDQIRIYKEANKSYEKAKKDYEATSAVRKVAGGVAAVSVGAAIQMGMGILGIDTNSRTGRGAIKGAYEFIAGEEPSKPTVFDETEYRAHCKLYDNHGTKTMLHCDYGGLDIDASKISAVALGRVSQNCKAVVDQYKCVTFFRDCDDNNREKDYGDESITIEFQTRADAERVYSYIKQY